VKSTPVAPSPFLDQDKALACIHCGLCLSSCPTYLETGNENDSPRGRIYLMRALQEGRLPLEDSTVRHIDLCLGCRACEAVCPSGVQYGELLEETRAHIETNYQRSTFQTFLRRIAIEKIFPFPKRMELALLPAKAAKALRIEKWLPKFAREALSLVPDNCTGLALPELSPAPPEIRQGRVGFISGCVMSVMFGETNANSVKLINRGGYDVVTPESQVCCGALYAHSGQLELARESARRNIAAFEELGVETVIINAAGCGSTLKEYHQLLRQDPVWKDRAVAFSYKVKDLTEWLVEMMKNASDNHDGPPISERGNQRNRLTPHPGPLPYEGRGRGGSGQGEVVTYHDACHLAHAQRITKPARELLRAAAGEQFVELPESDVCCGSAGSYNLTEPEMAERLQRRKIENILKTGAKVVITTNPGCILQIRAGLKKAGAGQIAVMHIADYLAGRAGDSSS